MSSISSNQDFTSLLTLSNNSDESSTNSIEPEPIETEYNETEDDPLGVKKLSLSFDYLMYKINEQIKTIAERSEACVNERKDGVELQLEEVDKSIQNLKDLIKSCEELDDEFIKVEQISFIVRDFRTRIKSLEDYFK